MLPVASRRRSSAHRRRSKNPPAGCPRRCRRSGRLAPRSAGRRSGGALPSAWCVPASSSPIRRLKRDHIRVQNGGELPLPGRGFLRPWRRGIEVCWCANRFDLAVDKSHYIRCRIGWPRKAVIPVRPGGNHVERFFSWNEAERDASSACCSCLWSDLLPGPTNRGFRSAATTRWLISPTANRFRARRILKRRGISCAGASPAVSIAICSPRIRSTMRPNTTATARWARQATQRRTRTRLIPMPGRSSTASSIWCTIAMGSRSGGSRPRST